jgi:C4-type Zn-finger protein
MEIPGKQSTVINCPWCAGVLEITGYGLVEVCGAGCYCRKCGYRDSAMGFNEIDAKRHLYEKIEEEVIKRAKKYSNNKEGAGMPPQ